MPCLLLFMKENNNMTLINGFTIRTTPEGESVYSNILLNGGSIHVNQHRLPITEDLFGSFWKQEITDRNGIKQTFLAGLERNFLPKIFPAYLDWAEEVLAPNGEWVPDKDYHEPVVALVLLKAKCKTNLRCPMSHNYWRKWVEAGSLRSDQTTIVKDQLRKDYPRDYNFCMEKDQYNFPMENLCLIGLVSLNDPPKRFVAHSVTKC